MERMIEATLIFFAIVFGVWFTRAWCERGYYLDGVTGFDGEDPYGVFRCHRIPARRIEEDRDQRPFLAMPDLPGEDFEYDSRIYCTGGSRPIVANERTVGCQPGGWQQ